jgi:hypothetical protein
MRLVDNHHLNETAEGGIEKGRHIDQWNDEETNMARKLTYAENITRLA